MIEKGRSGRAHSVTTFVSDYTKTGQNRGTWLASMGIIFDAIDGLQALTGSYVDGIIAPQALGLSCLLVVQCTTVFLRKKKKKKKKR
jgi:hypothetical protein